MKFVLVTQRVEHLVDRGESRDAIDQKWSKLLFEANLLPLFLPNDVTIAKAMINNIQGAICGALLTGGNSIQCCEGDSPERDEMELFLVDYCIEHKMPVLGVCRGMQVLLDKYGGEFKKVKGQVLPSQQVFVNSKEVTKNSYHDWSSVDIPQEFIVFAETECKIVKGVKHQTEALTGIMWHPERLVPFHADDIEMLKGVFKA